MNNFNIKPLNYIDDLIKIFFKEELFNKEKYIELIKLINKEIVENYDKDEIEVLQSHILVDLIEVTFNHFKIDKNILIELLLTNFNIKYNKLVKNCFF